MSGRRLLGKGQKGGNEMAGWVGDSPAGCGGTASCSSPPRRSRCTWCGGCSRSPPARPAPAGGRRAGGSSERGTKGQALERNAERGRGAHLGLEGKNAGLLGLALEEVVSENLRVRLLRIEGNEGSDVTSELRQGQLALVLGGPRRALEGETSWATLLSEARFSAFSIVNRAPSRFIAAREGMKRSFCGVERGAGERQDAGAARQGAGSRHRRENWPLHFGAGRGRAGGAGSRTAPFAARMRVGVMSSIPARPCRRLGVQTEPSMQA